MVVGKIENISEFLKASSKCHGRKWFNLEETKQNFSSRLKYAMDFINMHKTTQDIVLYKLEGLSWDDIACRVNRSRGYISNSYNGAIGKLVNSGVVYKVLDAGIEAFESYREFLGKDCPLVFIPEMYQNWLGFFKSFKNLGIVVLSNFEKYTYENMPVSSKAKELVRHLDSIYGLGIKEQ